MELMFQWFFIVKLMATGLFLFSGYKYYKSKFKSKMWLIIVLVMATITIIAPIKMDVNTSKQTSRTNVRIAENKEIPPMVEDNSFKDRVANTKGITEDDLK